MGTDISKSLERSFAGSSIRSAIANTGVTSGTGQNSANQDSTSTASLFNNAAGLRAQELSDFVSLAYNNGNNALKYVNDNSPWNLAKAFDAKQILSSKSSALNADPLNPNYKIDPKAYDDFGKGGLEGYYGQGFSGQYHRRDFKLTEVPSDSALKNIPGVDAHKLWNNVRSNLIGGVFADDAHLNKALNQTLAKFDGKFEEATKNADSLSLATAFNLSKDGLHKNGIGSMMEAYSKNENYIPEGIITKQYLGAFYNKLQETGSLTDALKTAKQFDVRDHGDLGGVTANETKGLAHTINSGMYRDLANEMGLDSKELRGYYANKNGFKEENSLYQLNGAHHLSATLDQRLTETGANGKSGFQNLVDQSEKKFGGDFRANLTVHVLNNPNDNTDSAAFDSTEGGLEGMAGLLKHKAGLTDNPITGNQFNLAYQGDEKLAKDGISNFIDKGHEAGIKFDRLTMVVKGHGGEDGSTMLQSGVIGQDYRGMGVKDSAYFKELLAKTPELKELNITYDSCHGLQSAMANAKAAQQAGKELGMNLKVNYSGSKIEGLVDAGQIHKADNAYDQIKTNADGTMNVSRERVDHGGSQESGSLYTQSEQAFSQRMQDERQKTNQNASAEQAPAQKANNEIVQEDVNQRLREQQYQQNIA